MRITGALGSVLVASLVSGCGGGTSPAARPVPTPGVTHTSATPATPRAMRWVSSYGVEVAVPKGWGFAFGPVRPDCIQRDGTPGNDPWAHDVPRRPYVEAGLFDQAVPAIGCMPKLSKDLPAAFGALPFGLWQPHVELARVDHFSGALTGRWTYRGWTLQRARFGMLSLSVLTRPGQADLGARVVASAHRVLADRLGCASVAPPQLARGQLPAGSALPAAAVVGSISVCEYDRTRPGAPRMAASTSIRGAPARAVVRAIRAAPLGGGPDRPADCLTAMHGDAALVLHFVDRGQRPSSADPQAFVSSDWCVGNGIAEAGGRHALTRDDCRPLYARPPVIAWQAQENIAPLCMRR